MRLRLIAPAALVAVLAVAGFVIASSLGERDARRESARRADVAATQIRGRLTQAAALTESLRRFMVDAGGTGVTSDRFARNAFRWLGPAHIVAAAWVEPVPATQRVEYERRIGRPIVARGQSRPAAAARSDHLAATVVSGFPPLDVPGIDLGGEPGMEAALVRAQRTDGVAATDFVQGSGLFLVAPATNLVGGALHAGYIVVCVPSGTLLSGLAGARIATGEAPGRAFTVAGRRFAVAMPAAQVEGSAAALPPIILGGGLVLALLAGALSVNRARRARTQEQLDRIFTVSGDLMVITSFDGYFTRVNPAGERMLGYSEAELIARPVADFVHPDDRERTALETAALARGGQTVAFENRLIRKDGAECVLEWTATPAPQERLIYGAARDVTERRRAQAEALRLTDEQIALRRVAVMVAGNAPPSELFGAIAEEIGRVLGTPVIRILRYENEGSARIVGSWGKLDPFRVGERYGLDGDSVAGRVFRTGRTARIDDYGQADGEIAETVRGTGLRATVGAPITVEGRVWGAILAATSAGEPPRPDTEARLGKFTALMATAIANAEARAEAHRLADGQAALRRVATLIAEESPPSELFEKVAEEVATVLGESYGAVLRAEGDGTATLVGVWGGRSEQFTVGARVPLDGGSATMVAMREARPVRIDDYSGSAGDLARRLGELGESGKRCAMGSPIVVRGHVWGGIGVARYDDFVPFDADAEQRLVQFADLVATAIVNAEARAEVKRLADEQAALRRVATLVAQEPSPAQVFAKVAEEAAAVLGGADCAVLRDDGDGSATAVGLWAGTGEFRVGQRFPLDGDAATMVAIREARPARVDDYSVTGGKLMLHLDERGVRCAVACPIMVRGSAWGGIGVARYKDVQPFGTEDERRLMQFADLVATAIVNAEARAEVKRLADQQAVLRRIATLVAQGAQPSDVFAAVAEETETMLAADNVMVGRYEPTDEVTVLAHRSEYASMAPPGTRLNYSGANLTSLVRRTERPARMAEQDTQSEIGALAAATRANWRVGAPIVVDGRLWGVIIAAWRADEEPPAGIEERLTQFAQLLGTAIANADGRDQLNASRARLLGAADDARRRVVRDLHDGAQQRLVHAIITLKLAKRALGDDDGQVVRLVADALEHAERGIRELRELSHGILPALLTTGGLQAAVEAFVERLDLPVRLDVVERRFPAEIEASAYFIVTEALTNVVKHASAGRVEVSASVAGATLRVEVRDDGVGGADPDGHGLVGLSDRAAALGGRLEVESAAGSGTRVIATLPLAE